MRLLTFMYNGIWKTGVLTDAGVVDVLGAGMALDVDVPSTPRVLYELGLPAVDSIRALLEQDIPPEYIHAEAELTLGVPVPAPQKILCVGLNYSRHAAESGMAEPASPVLFSKFANTLAAHHENIPMSPEWAAVDYEAELAVIIGKRAKNVSEADALNYVLGYANANDLSERDLQLKLPGGQWLLGKTPDKFFPMGPYVVTADEADDPGKMPIRGWMNGELRQDSNTSDMIFNVAEVIAYASKIMTLEPGDIISTGTPEGVILGMAEKVYMQPGDEYTIEIGNLGRLTNRMVGA